MESISSEGLNTLFLKQIKLIYSLLETGNYNTEIPKLVVIEKKGLSFQNPVVHGLTPALSFDALNFDIASQRQQTVSSCGVKFQAQFPDIVCVFIWYAGRILETEEDVILVYGNDLKRRRCSALIFTQTDGSLAKASEKQPIIFPYNQDNPEVKRNLLDSFWDGYFKGKGFTRY